MRDSRGARPRATVFGAILDGWQRVLRAPAVTLGVLAATFVLALPLSVVLSGALEQNLSVGLIAEDARGINRAFTHEILGFGGTIHLAGDFLDRAGDQPALAGAVAAYLGLWMFLWGGILDRYARARPIRTAAFFAACGVYFVRFLRLAIPIGLAYWLVLGWFRPWLFGSLHDRLTRDMAADSDAVAVQIGLYLALSLALLLVHAVADVAQVRAVVEDRRSMLGALAASLRFIRRRPARVAALYAISLASLAVVLLVWRYVAPGPGAQLWLALTIAQAYLLVRLWIRLALAASIVAFFQQELAHAAYTAAPLPVWPDSPAAEALDNLRRLGEARRDDPA